MIAVAKDDNKDYRFQVIGLDRETRAAFLARCKLNNKSGSDVLKKFMKDYANDRSAE